MPLAAVTLDDKYTLERGRICLNGIQALVRLPMMQRRRDRQQDRQYRQLHHRLPRLAPGAIDQRCGGQRNSWANTTFHFQPGVNEDLAATAVWGSQQARSVRRQASTTTSSPCGTARAPALTAAATVLRHANLAGCA